MPPNNNQSPDRGNVKPEAQHLLVAETEPVLPSPVEGFTKVKQSGAGQNGASGSGRRKKIIIAILAVVVALVIAMGAFAACFYVSLQARDASAPQKRVTIAEGASITQMANQLQGEEIIKSAAAFQLYVRLQGIQANLQAGTYVFSPSQPVQDIAMHMVEGRVDAFRVTILPGQTLDELTDSLKDYGFSEASIQEALSAEYDHPLLADKPKNNSLEGYIFPETYEIAGNGTVNDLFERSFDTFYERLQEADIIRKLSKQKLNLHEGITLSSIVQKEVSDTADQRQVAQVFLKRLREDIELGSDVTFIYAAQQLGVEPSVGLDSPYNTRKYKGLPPGPISNFNFSAIEAVASPARGNYLYFVAGDGDYAGQTFFSRTLEEHESNTKKYCSELCQ
jgi:UPF0755 protein